MRDHSVSLEKMEDDISKQEVAVPLLSTEPTTSLIAGENDLLPIKNFKDFTKEFYVESVKLWYLAAPAIFTSLCQYSLGAVTQILAGHVGTIQLAAVSIENSVIAGFSFGTLMGMGSALETLCGQAYGAGQLDMMGIYMQRSWVILLSTAIIMMFIYIFTAPILLLIGQTPEISAAAGSFSIWMIPQLFAYAMVFPLAKFLQAQSKMMAMAVIAAAAMVLHIIFSWLLMLKLDLGLPGAAVVLNGSWWFIVAAQLVYILSGSCGEAWSGFSWKAFQNLWGFLKLSLASAVMLCLEVWYYNILILFAGYLKNAEIAVDSISVCMNIFGWTVMVALGFNVAISVRVSNELGAGHPRTAKFSVIAATITSLVFGFLMALVLIVFRKQYPALFADSLEVQQLVIEITPLLALSIVISNVQPTLSGVAIGAGWQAYVAYVNLVSYYIFGLPLGFLLAYTMNQGVKGIWYGMIGGTGVQTCFLFWMIYRTNWNKEASMAEGRINEWGGKINKDKVSVVA